MGEFHKVKPNEVVYPIMPGPYKMACCDCGLVHDWYFEIVRVLDPSKPISEDVVVDDPQLKVRLTCERNNRSTAAMRREDRKKGHDKYHRYTDAEMEAERHEDFITRLQGLRDKIVESGQELLSWDGVLEEVKKRRGSV